MSMTRAFAVCVCCAVIAGCAAQQPKEDERYMYLNRQGAALAHFGTMEAVEDHFALSRAACAYEMQQTIATAPAKPFYSSDPEIAAIGSQFISLQAPGSFDVCMASKGWFRQP